MTDFTHLDLNKSYTYADYLTWRFQERLELIKGKIFIMNRNQFLLKCVITSGL
ncbi:hypothetical protein [Niabella drilacis]|uniref:hypothetical protein n=1 Tax=Niabella drilacis (strain DSM 25811 / CCM 8410 / CCUG 62505 / LMG 26954 / E90) TaxID=1285928 RepID=UPI0015A39A0C|nr:hypothetical protein [Niabella drilacis]